MGDPKMIRADLVAAVITALKTITTTNGYNCTLSADDVTDWGVGSPDSDAEFSLIVNDANGTIDEGRQEISRGFAYIIQIQISGVVMKGAQTASWTRKLMDDVYKAIYTGKETWEYNSSYNGLKVLPAGDQLEVFEEDVPVGVFQINFDFRTHTGSGWRI